MGMSQRIFEESQLLALLNTVIHFARILNISSRAKAPIMTRR